MYVPSAEHDLSAIILLSVRALMAAKQMVRSKDGVKYRRRRTRFPLRELEIRRQSARDPKFEEICRDYDEALMALRRWEGAGPAGATRAEDYRRILEELEAEILAILDRPRRRFAADGG